jgi:hypothetical protein
MSAVWMSRVYCHTGSHSFARISFEIKAVLLPRLYRYLSVCFCCFRESSVVLVPYIFIYHSISGLYSASVFSGVCLR